MDLDLMEKRVIVQCFKDRAKTARPALDPGFVADQILAHFKQNMGNSARHAVPEHCIAFQATIIGLIIANHNIGGLFQLFNQSLGCARIIVPQHTGMPWPRNIFQSGV